MLSSRLLRNLLILLIIVSGISCQYNGKEIGVGVFHFEPKKEATLNVYQNSKTDSLLFGVEARLNEVSSRLYLKSYVNNSIRFSPIMYGQLRGFLSLRIIGSEAGRLKVVINEQTQASGWVEGSFKDVDDWESFLMSLHHISSKEGGLHKFPRVGGETINTSGNICLNVIDIQESWLKVHHDASRCDDPDTRATGPSGFIRWKNDGKLLIHFRM